MSLAQQIEDELSGSFMPIPVSHLTADHWQRRLLAEAARELPDVDWRENALTVPQQVYCKNAIENAAPVLGALFGELRREMHWFGACVVSIGDMPGDISDVKKALVLLSSAICRPFGAFKKTGLWQTLAVDPAAQNLRANSVGYIPFHFDLDQASRPPEFVGLHCLRADPFGGGESLLVNYKQLFRPLSADSKNRLSDIEFDYASLYGTHNLGAVRNPHPLIDRDFKQSGEWVCLYNGKARPSLESKPEVAAVFDVLERAFKTGSTRMRLKAGDFLLVDQRQVLHARTELAERPVSVRVDPSNDRLLLQIYGNPA